VANTGIINSKITYFKAISQSILKMNDFDFLPDLHPKTKRIQLQNLNMAYWELNSDRTRTIIFVHGFSGSKEEWIFQLDYLLNRGYRLIAIDQEGHGETDLTSRKTTIEDLAEDLFDFLMKKGITRVILVGHSLGGMVCQQFILTHPELVERLVLIGTSPRFENPPPKAFLDFIRTTDVATIIKTTSRFASLTLDKLPEEQREYYKKLKKWSIQRRTRSITKEAYVKFMLLTEKKKFNVVDDLNKIQVPTLITCGTFDKLIRLQNSKLINEKIPLSTLKLFESCGHAPPREYPEQFNQILLEFLQE